MGSDGVPGEESQSVDNGPSGVSPADTADGRPDTPGSGGEDGNGFTFESYYDLLGVSDTATTAEIEQAYRELAKQHHPDASDQPDRIAERRFQQLLTAREVLTAAERRRAYDELGHEAYRRQSGSPGNPVSQADIGGESADEGDPEPRPGPSEGAADPGQVQRSARGAAHRRGDPVVTAVEDSFGGAVSGGEQQATDSGDEHTGRGIYRLLTGDGPPGSRSLGYVAARWARSWHTRAAVALGSTLLAAAALAALPVVFEAAGVDVSVPDPTAGRLYLVALVAGATHAGYSAGRVGVQLPRGGFLADRDHGRFSTATGQAYRRRGVAALLVALVLAGASAHTGTGPWTHTADALQGNLSGPVPWLDAPEAGWTTALDALLSGVFAVAAVSGTLLLGVGASVALWRGRYERGLRVRPGLWAPALVAAPLSAVVALVAGPVTLVSLPALSALPETVALVAGVDGSAVTAATVAVVGTLCALAGVALVRVRAALAPSAGRAGVSDSG